MTDAQILQNLLAVYEAIVVVNERVRLRSIACALLVLKEVIAWLRQRIALEEGK